MSGRYAEKTYTVTPECPLCGQELEDAAESIDRYDTDGGERVFHIIDCYRCEILLELTVNHANPLSLEVRVTPAVVRR